LGTDNVTNAPQAKQSLITLFTRFKGGISQLYSPAKLNAKASTLEVPGMLNSRIKFINLKFSEFAKRSKE
jgi:hypothetical protein